MNTFVKQTGLPIVISLAGGSIAHFAGLPAGMLMGGAVAVAVAAVAGMNVRVPKLMRNSSLVMVGMTLGSNVSSDTLALLPQWPWTLLALVFALAISVATSTVLLSSLFGHDRGTAYLSSFPGHLSLVMALAESGYGNPTSIAVIQSTRILLLTVLAPLVALYATHGTVDMTANVGRDPMDLIPLFILAVACIAGGLVFNRLKISAPFVLGPMLVAMTGKLAGIYEGAVPLELTLAGYVGMGVLIGSRFTGVSMDVLSRSALGGIVSTIVPVVYITAIVFFIAGHVGMPFGQVWLGLAPGGIESMGAIGLALGFDTAFIAGHHAVRMFLLTFAISSVGLVAPRREDSGSPKA